MYLVVETSQITVSLRTRVERHLSGSVPSPTHLLSWYVTKSYYSSSGIVNIFITPCMLCF